ncbi:DUF2577 domain-containing protein [Lysinibacillus xylanilyticus]|uniref:DUF2577 domain-containing protein n=1 Tax=Lysinibacillus xylanilyticus TaxID=582475 RepID=UPI003CFD4FE5
MTDILKLIKKIAIDAVNSQKLTDIVYGTVISTSPLKVQIDQKLILEEVHLKLTQAVKDSGLIQGDKVTMIRAHGGQQYLIIDKEVDE